MIDYLNGIINHKTTNEITLDVSGVGYAVYAPVSTFEKLPQTGELVKIYIFEAVSGMYGGVINLYGFLTREERDMFILIKDEVPGTGAKKALEYLDKISKSFADFKTAVETKNTSLLTGVFGFTKKTAEKLIAALKDKISGVQIIGQEKWSGVKDYSQTSVVSQAIAGLIAIGYKELPSRNAVSQAYSEDENVTLEKLIKKALNLYKDI
ncbi:Holliday junction branch migration protein RuvA [Endomicrobium proavitum]|uniref:Holliday junction branch migration complex subunit RuvA n=1 Tax=Endomicrobium proavitum TaxID=1408281 RepID=A0A0G3WJ77_9BACT|nr:Holliday junction branch migration protein RuvA [Endomicrobium proavitum]AKL97937.1 Holliday junction ATP-dependent DNA helicase RuvA [Endomicrobium proavitum]